MKRSAKLLAIIVLLITSVGCGGTHDKQSVNAGAEALLTEQADKNSRVETPSITFQIRHPGKLNNTLLVRLDVDRLRAHNLSKEDVMKAMTPSGIVDPEQPLPPPGVVFNTRLAKLEDYEKVILKANAEGDIVRLKDVAKVELLSN